MVLCSLEKHVSLSQDQFQISPEEPEPVEMDLEEVGAKQVEEEQGAQQPEGEPPQELEQAYALEFIPHSKLFGNCAESMVSPRMVPRQKFSKGSPLQRKSQVFGSARKRHRNNIEIMLNRFS